MELRTEAQGARDEWLNGSRAQSQATPMPPGTAIDVSNRPHEDDDPAGEEESRTARKIVGLDAKRLLRQNLPLAEVALIRPTSSAEVAVTRCE